jgi:hypothetical protein
MHCVGAIIGLRLMTARVLDRLLAVLVVGVLASGLLTLRAGAPGDAWVFLAHGLVAGTLLVAVFAKLGRSVPKAIVGRRWRLLGLALVLAVLVLGSLLGGFAWVASGRLLTIGSVTLMTAHAWLGILLIPIVLAHLLPHRWRILQWGRPRATGASRAAPTGQRLPRRTFISVLVLGAGGLVAWSIPEILDRVSGRPRRFTGSRAIPSSAGLPSTTFLGEAAPTIDRDAWRLRLTGLVDDDLELDAAGLVATAEPTELTAILDCTSGWAYEGRWRGLPLGRLLDQAGVRATAEGIEARSVTGWSTRLTLAEARACLVATHLDERPLGIEHGAPCRLVVPMRRGLDWVKWLAEIRVV